MKKVFFSLSIILLITCYSFENNFEEKEILYETLGQDYLHGSGDEGFKRENIIVKNKSDWIDLLNQMNSHTTAKFENTEINFDTELVIAVFDFAQGNPISIDVVKIVEKEISIEVSIDFLTHSTSSVISQGYHIVKIPNSNKKVNFIYLNDK